MEKDMEDMDVTMKIKCFIDTYRKKQISFAILVTVLDGMGSTLDASKEVIKALLHILLEQQDEPESKNENIGASKETQTEGMILDDLEVFDYVSNGDFEYETEELPSESIKVEEASLEEARLFPFDDKNESFETNDSDANNDLESSSIEMQHKRARLECLICVKTFRYRIELNKHIATHDINESINENEEMDKNGEGKATNDHSTTITDNTLPKLNNSQADQNIESNKTKVDPNTPQNTPLGSEVQTKPIFTYKWQAVKNRNSKGKWVTMLIIVPYRYTYHSTLQSGVLRFICLGCRKNKKYTHAFVKNIGFEESGKPKLELISSANDHKCVPEPNGSTRFLNSVILNRYSNSNKNLILHIMFLQGDPNQNF